MRRTFALVVFAAAVTTCGFGANWFIDPDAAGSNSGSSWTNAWQSFSNVTWASISPGDTIYISGGSSSKAYSEQLNVAKSGSSGNPITIRVGQDAGHNGVAILTLAADSYGAIAISGKSNVVVDGGFGGACHIRLTGSKHCGLYVGGGSSNLVFRYLEADSNGDSSNELAGDGIYFDMSVNEPNTFIGEVAFCKIHDNYSRGIIINGPTNTGTMYGRFKIHDNEIYNIQDDSIFSTAGGMDIYANNIHGIIGVRGHPDGMQLLNGYVRVYDNYIHDIATPLYTPNSYIFVDLNKGDVTCGNILVYNNILVHNQPPISSTDYVRGIAYKMEPTQTGSSNILIANNTIIGMPAWGIESDFRQGSVNGAQIVNNLIYNSGQLPGCTALVAEFKTGDTVGSYTSSPNIVLDYNLVNGGPAGNSSWTPASGTQAHGLTKAPLLSTSYQLNSGSAAIGAGTALAAYFADDYAGKVRGNVWDVGALQSMALNIVLLPPGGLRVVY